MDTEPIYDEDDVRTYSANEQFINGVDIVRARPARSVPTQLSAMRNTLIVSVVIVILYLMCHIYGKNGREGVYNRSDLKYFIDRAKRTAKMYPSGHIQYNTALDNIPIRDYPVDVD